MAAAPPPLAPDLVEGLRRLKLATMREQAPDVLQSAKTQRWGAEDVLRTLLKVEIAAREAANRRMRLKQRGQPMGVDPNRIGRRTRNGRWLDGMQPTIQCGTR